MMIRIFTYKCSSLNELKKGDKIDYIWNPLIKLKPYRYQEIFHGFFRSGSSWVEHSNGDVKESNDY